jgi:hypothetical protein
MNLICLQCSFKRDQYPGRLVEQCIRFWCGKKYGGISKWVYEVSIIVIAIVVIIFNDSVFAEGGTKAPTTHTFDIQSYYNKTKDYYGDVSLDTVAKDAYNRHVNHTEFPDYDTWKKAVGIELLIQEDIKRRTPPPPSFSDKIMDALTFKSRTPPSPSFLDKVMGVLPFRYDEESIQGRLYRYDRITKTVQQRRGSNEAFQWVPVPRFKNLRGIRGTSMISNVKGKTEISPDLPD